MAGQAGVSHTAPIIISHVNPDLFSPGRQRLVEATLADLSAGFIDTGSEALTDTP
jgi:hypothetical protein